MSESHGRKPEDEFVQSMVALHVLPRIGQPDDLASTICFLLSDDASWVTGQVWSVNGGIVNRR